jgi:CRISPR-associated protein Csb2
VLDALIRRHDAFLARVTDDGFTPVPPLAGFKTAAYDNVDRINLRHCAAFELIPADLSDRRRFKAFRQELIVHVAAMLRHAACEAVMNDLDEVGWRTKTKAEEFVAGHEPRKTAESFPRFSYLPLPNVPLPAQPHADGMIRRVLIAETSGMDGRWAAWAQQRLSGLALRDEKSKRDVALLRPALTEDSIFSTFTRESDRWQTITPVILPGFDSRQFAKRDKLLIKCFVQAGLPLELIADFEVQRSPWLRASAQTRSYKRSVHLDHLPAWHLRIYFKRAIAGPVAIGAGRHCGMGLLTQMF